MKTKSTLFQNGDTTMKTRIKNLFLVPALIAGLSLIPAGRVTAWTVIAINSEGANPNAGLILSNNTLYGTAAFGGSSGKGTVFSRSFNLNHAPLALATVSPLFAIPQGGTNRFILSPNNANATIVLDGSQSSDADNDPLQFNWYADGQPNALATGALATNQFAVGPHNGQLVVSAGHDTAT